MLGRLTTLILTALVVCSNLSNSHTLYAAGTKAKKRIAEIVFIRGKAAVKRAATGKSVTAATGTPLFENDALEVVDEKGQVKKAKATVLFYGGAARGKLVVVRGGKTLTIKANDPKKTKVEGIMERIVKEFGKAGRAREDVGEIIGGSRRGDGDVQFLAPRGVVNTLRPRFIWTGESGAKGYRITIREDAQRVLVKRTTDCSFGYPQDMPPLKRGASYSWKVETIREFEVIDPRRVTIFSILDEERAAEIIPLREWARTALANDPEDGSPHYILGTIYIGDRLYIDAIAELRKLLKMSSDDAGAKKILAKLYRQLDFHKEAIAAYEKLAVTVR